jgi:uridine kinase
MELAAYLANRYLESFRSGRPRMLVGVCGRAGAGKSTLVRSLVASLSEKGIEGRTYSGDWRFVHDSETRRRWIDQRSRQGLTPYLYSINQFIWWDFEKIKLDLEVLGRGEPLVITEAYDRDSGRRQDQIEIPSLSSGIVLYENSVLGGVEVLEGLDVIAQLTTSDAACLRRLIEKDAGRRSVSDIAARFLTTSYSENQFFELLERMPAKRVTCSDDGRLSASADVHPVRTLPIPVELLRSLSDSEPRPPKDR